MAEHRITTPNGTTVTGNGCMAELRWSPGFASSWSGTMNKKQAFIDSEVLRLCAPLMPLKTGALIGSGTTGTKIGSGEVVYQSVYAKKQYYDTADSRPYDGARGAHWFERMKAAHKDQILRAAQKIG